MNDVIITRTIAASRDEVYRAWTDPDHLGWFLNDQAPTPNQPIVVDASVAARSACP